MGYSKKNAFTIVFILALVVVSILFFLFFSKNILGTNSLSKVYKVGILNGFDFFGKTVDGFKAEMAELGYVEGRNIYYDEEKKDVNLEEYRSALRKFADEKVDLILTFPTEASMEGKKIAQETGIPLVFTNANIEDMGLVNSIKEPGNNLTGVRYPGPDIALKRLEVMLEILPDVKNILVPYDKNYPNVPPQLKVLREGAPALKVKLIEAPVGTPEELRDYLDSIVRKGQRIDAILTLAETVSAAPPYVDVYGKFAEDNKIPVGGALILKKDGYSYESLFGVVADSFAVGEQAAVLANKVFNGISAGTIPVVSADIYLEVNYKKAMEMGIPLSESFLSTVNNIVR